jgi:flagellar biosynthesis protein FlhB
LRASHVAAGLSEPLTRRTGHWHRLPSVSERSEAPTPRRLRKAREEGDSGVSAYGAQAVAFLVAVALAPSAITALASRAGADLQVAVGRESVLRAAVQFDPGELGATVAALTVPVLLAAGVTAAAAQALQTGGILTAKRLAPRLDRLNPFAGIKGLFSATRFFAVVRAVVAGSVVAWLAWQSLSGHIVDFARTAGQVRSIGPLLREVAGGLVWRVGLLGIAIGALDVLVTRRAWLRKLRMSKEEVRREYRETEGDPLLKAARERAYRDLVAQADIANVRAASVVVVNPAHLACALRYDEKLGDEAPLVIAAGEGGFAARIVQAANDYGIPVVRDAPLARVLVELVPGQVIPEALYEAVAEILRLV